MPPKVIISSRSILASNVYKLLLSAYNPEIISTQRFESARPWFFRKGKIDLAVFHSDIFTPKFDGYWIRLSEDEPFKEVPKIFIMKSSPREREWSEKLKTLSKSYVLERPFHPNEFNALLSEIFK